MRSLISLCILSWTGKADKAEQAGHIHEILTPDVFFRSRVRGDPVSGAVGTLPDSRDPAN